MGRRIVLSESQFKEYVKSQLNENMGVEEDVVSVCNDYADRLKVISDQMRELGNQYNSFFKASRDYIENIGIGVRDARTCKKYGDYGIMLYIDISGFQIPEEHADEGTSFYIQCEIEDGMNELLKRGFDNFFERANVYYENGVVIIAPEPKEYLSFDKMYEFLSNS